jgi:hypothetical protein
MTTTLLPSETTSLSDSAAFRSVLSPDGEKILLVMLDPDRDEILGRALRAVHELRGRGASLRAVVFGGAASLRSDRSAEIPGDVGVLESWARPLLPATLAVADAILCVGPASDQLLAELSSSDGAAKVLRSVEEIESLAAAPGGRAQESSRTPVRSVRGPELAKSSGRFVLQNDWGIGDELLLSGVAREILRAHPGTELWIRSRYGFAFSKNIRTEAAPPDVRRIETIYQNPTLYGPAAHSPFPGHLVQQMLDKFALDTGLVVRAVDVRPELEIPPEQARERATIIVHSRPNPRLLSKDWGLGRWQDLVNLLTKEGIHVRQVGGKEEPLLERVEDLRGAPVSELSEVFSRSAGVACIVGFLMHLAEATRTPAVVLYGGREHPAIDGYPDQVHLSSGPLACRGRWGCHLGPDLECPHGMKCMERLTPQLVAGEVLTLLSAGGLR